MKCPKGQKDLHSQVIQGKERLCCDDKKCTSWGKMCDSVLALFNNQKSTSCCSTEKCSGSCGGNC